MARLSGGWWDLGGNDDVDEKLASRQHHGVIECFLVDGYILHSRSSLTIE